MNVNKIFLGGNLTRDPEFKGDKEEVCAFGMAVNRRWKNRDGSDGESTLFMDCVVFGKAAPVVMRYFTKGDPIFVEGRLEIDEWEGDTGTQRRPKVTVTDFSFVKSKRDSDGGGRSERKPERKPTEPVGGDMDDDNIPF